MNPIADSERLTYRLLRDTPEDAELLWQLDQNPAVMEFINRGVPTTRQELQERVLPRLRAFTNPENGWGLWGAFHRENGEFAGWVLIRPDGFFVGHTAQVNLCSAAGTNNPASGSVVADEDTSPPPENPAQRTVRRDRVLEIGWRFRQEGWGQGFATEAAKAVAAALIAADTCDQMFAIALPENAASINVMKKLGMQHVSTTDHDEEPYGKYQLARYEADVQNIIC